MSSKVTCSSCGHSWNKSDSSKKDVSICHICGKDNTMKDGGGVAKTDATRVNKQLVPLNAKKVTQRDLNEREAQLRRDRIAKANAAKDKMYTNPDEPIFGFSPEVFAESTSAIGDKLRLSEKPNVFDDYINPAPMFGQFASGLGQVPLNIKKGNYGEAALNTLSPVMAGAVERLLSPIINKVMKRGNKSAILAESNQLAPPPSEIIIPNNGYIMGMSSPSNITRSPAGGLFGMTAEQTNAALVNNYNPLDLSSLITSTSLRGRLDQGIQSALGMNTPRNYITGSRPRQSLLQSLGESIYTGLGGRRSHNQYVPLSQLITEQNTARPISQSLVNRSGLAKEQLLSNDALVNKDVVSKMAPEEFVSTVFKPSGEVVPYQFTHDPLPGVYGMSPSQYANRFNENLDLLNDIISKQNKTGVDYRVTGLDESGMLTFHTPAQGNIPAGSKTWAARIIPGEFRGEIQDIPNAEYYKSIPGLNMASSSQGVFSDNVTRRGSGAYEAINEYLKRLDLGRVKPGFNSQSDYSRPLWENAIKKGKAFGYYSNPHTVYGAMKTVAPVIGAGAVASQFVDQKKNGGWLDKYNDGGPVQPNYNNYSVSAPEGFQGDGYSNVGRNYSPAWGGQFAMGGSLPGATGFMYARVGAPSKGPHRNQTDVTDASAQNGTEMRYYQEGLDWKPKSISKNGSVIKDDRGQWAHPGEITQIGSNQITMQGVPYPVMGISDTGDMQMMYPNKDYVYDGESVIEYPMMQNGGVAYADNTRVGNVPRYTRPSNYQGNQPDTVGENIFEVIDPSGISSWDDIYRSYNQTGMSGQTALEAIGAIPMLGNMGKLTKAGIHLKKYQGLDKTLYKTLPKNKILSGALSGAAKAARGSDAYQAYDQYKQGGQLTKLDQLLNFTNYNTKQPGGWLDKYNN